MKKTRCFVFPFIPPYGRLCWRCSHASDTALPPPGSPAHGWMLRYTVFSCFTGSSAVVAGVILLASSCGIAHIFLVGLRVGLFPGLTPLPQEAAEVLPTQLLPLLGGVRRKSILHENDLACVGYQRALKNPAVLGRPFDRV